MSKNTPLIDVHRRLGAYFTEFAGWTMPVRYTSDVTEHHAVRTTAGLFDLSHMGELELAGPGAAAALDVAVVGKPSAMSTGQARYSMICDEAGGILDDLVIYRLADHDFLVVSNASNVATVHGALVERTTGHDVDLCDATDDWALMAVQGSAASRILTGITDVDLTALKYYTIASGTLADVDVLLARTGYTGEDGFELYCRPDAAAAVWEALTEAGAPHGLVPAGLACRDTLRLEAGMPLHGQELSVAITPFEAGLGRVVDFTKEGGFVGEAALVARRDAGPTRTLVGLVCTGPRSPRHGYDVLDPETDQVVGQVTSGAPSPTLGRPIAIAFVPVALKAPGTRLVVDIRGVHGDVEVVSLPFYRRADT